MATRRKPLKLGPSERRDSRRTGVKNSATVKPGENRESSGPGIFGSFCIAIARVKNPSSAPITAGRIKRNTTFLAIAENSIKSNGEAFLDQIQVASTDHAWRRFGSGFARRRGKHFADSGGKLEGTETSVVIVDVARKDELVRLVVSRNA